MSTLYELVCDKVREGAPHMGDYMTRKLYAETRIDVMTNTELLKLISDALSKQMTEHLRPWL